MSVIVAIDPGPERSAWIAWNRVTGFPRQFGISENDELLTQLQEGVSDDVDAVVIEKIESFGMSVGAEVFETVYWTGRFVQALLEATRGSSRPAPLSIARIGRMKVKTNLCHSAKAKDSNIRQALIDRFGGSAAVGRKAAPGPLYGIAKDVWSALAVAVTYADQDAAAA